MTLLFGKSMIVLGGGLAFENASSLQDKDGNFQRMPTPAEYAATTGIRVSEEKPDMAKLGKIGKKSDLDDDPGDEGDNSGGNGSFLWSL
jgi:hypothetical protein